MFYKVPAKFFLLPGLLLLFVHVKAQEVLFPLSGNPVIRQYLKANPPSPVFNRMLSADTLTVPFIDDFSRQGVYPDPDLWEDSDVFINSTYCDHPVTIGVATFDGIDKFGNPYNPVSGATDTADFLTSKPIDLNLPNDTTVWFSFYYQPQGLGDEPEDGDSLTLYFKNSSGEWIEVWSKNGRPDTAFQRVNIHITDNSFLFRGFRFRFMNYATLNGNRDHWNIDYVWLSNLRSNNDPLFDISFVNPIESYLKEFSAMPYSHYKYFAGHGNNPVKDSVVDLVRTFNFIGTTNVTPYCKITDDNGSTILNQFFTGGLFNPVQNSDTSLSVLLPDTVFPSDTTKKYADFLIRHYIISSHSGFASNDTSYLIQHFKNYYAYDDGSAEWAFGIPELGAKIAYRFNVKMQDTLRGVQIYFNPVGDLVYNKLFNLCYWSNVDVVSNTDHLVHLTINQRPANIDSINGFATYLFDTAQVVPAGPMYVGWIQTDATLLGIGVDKNTASTNNMFSFFAGHWHPSQVQGSWMMRPLFGDSLTNSPTIGIQEPAASTFSFDVYPNPASTEVSIALHVNNQSHYDYGLFNNLGELILTGSVQSGKINVAGLANGFYFIRLTDRTTRESVTKKLVIQRN